MGHEWENGLCGCFSDVGTCCLTCWCPCITYGKAEYRLNHGNDPANNGYSTCNGPCTLYTFLHCFTGSIGACVLTMLQRGNMRERANIDGNGCTDCMASCCCLCCAQVQNGLEARDWQEKKGVYAQLSAPMQPAPQQQMYYGHT